MQKKFYVHSLGCSKNLVDTEGLAGYIKDSGFVMTGSFEEAGLVVLNTCSFVKEAEDETAHWIRYYSAEKRKFGFTFVVMGCIVESGGRELLEEFPGVDHFVGINQAKKIRDIFEGTAVRRFVGGGNPFFWEAGRRKGVQEGLPSRYIKLSEGCSRKCSFCGIPQIRGRFRSIPCGDVVKEARLLVSEGAKEINAVSQDTTSYGRDLKNGDDLIKVIRRVTAIRGLEFFRLLYLYPDGVSDRLINEFRDSEKLCGYFDIPVQHISDRVLKGMRRASTEKSIRRLLEKIKKVLPDAALRTTLIVGFPGETEREFERLLSFVKEGWFDHLGAFAYSPHPRLEGLKSAGRNAALRRQKMIYDAQKKVVAAKNRMKLGAEEKVLIESFAGGYSTGRSEYQAPEVDGYIKIKGKFNPGDMVNVRFVSSKGYDIEGVAL